MQKGKVFFNIIIIIVTIALISVAGYAIYYYISRKAALSDAETAVEEFENEIIVVAVEDENINQNEGGTENIETPKQNPTSSTNRRTTTTYRGYNLIGTIQIPKTKVKAPIVDTISPSSISAAVAFLYGPDNTNKTLNQVGNTVLVAHNYRNGTFFSNNKKLAIGDKIYITDQSGQKIEYTIYKSYTTTETDFDYATRNTDGKREISLSTCTTDPTKRLVIWAKES